MKKLEKTAKLPVAKANAFDKKLEEEKSAPPATKTIEMVEKARDKNKE